MLQAFAGGLGELQASSCSDAYCWAFRHFSLSLLYKIWVFAFQTADLSQVWGFQVLSRSLILSISLEVVPAEGVGLRICRLIEAGSCFHSPQPAKSLSVSTGSMLWDNVTLIADWIIALLWRICSSTLPILTFGVTWLVHSCRLTTQEWAASPLLRLWRHFSEAFEPVRSAYSKGHGPAQNTSTNCLQVCYIIL